MQVDFEMHGEPLSGLLTVNHGVLYDAGRLALRGTGGRRADRAGLQRVGVARRSEPQWVPLP